MFLDRSQFGEARALEGLIKDNGRSWNLNSLQSQYALAK
jgi:hypothetical protein